MNLNMKMNIQHRDLTDNGDHIVLIHINRMTDHLLTS